MPQWLVKPANQVVAAGDPLRVEVEIGANATGAKMLPGRIVILDDADGTVKEAGAKADGFRAILDVAASKTKTTAYAVGDQAMVIVGECFAVVTLLAGENVSRGDVLVSAADGKAAKQAVGAMGGQGSPIGETMEASNVTVDAEILIHWNPSHEPAAAS